jgi:hypothetical protein
MTKIIITLIKYAFYLGIKGQLVDVTIGLRKEAYHETQRGLIALTKLNHLLNH